MKEDISAKLFASIRFMESNLIPKRAKFQLSPEFAKTMPNAWVTEYNQWMREFFGEEECIYMVNPRAIGLMGDNYFIARPETMAMIRAFT